MAYTEPWIKDTVDDIFTWCETIKILILHAYATNKKKDHHDAKTITSPTILPGAR